MDHFNLFLQLGQLGGNACSASTIAREKRILIDVPESTGFRASFFTCEREKSLEGKEDRQEFGEEEDEAE